MELQLKTDFSRKTCGTCGVDFFVTTVLENEYVRTGQSWTCPNGHKRSYVTSEAEKYQKLYEEEVKARKVLQGRFDEQALILQNVRKNLTREIEANTDLRTQVKKLRGQLIIMKRQRKV